MSGAPHHDTVVIQHQAPLQSAMTVPAPTEMPEVYRETAPMNEAELTSLLLASPLYRKMENIKKQIAAAAQKNDENQGQWSALMQKEICKHLYRPCVAQINFDVLFHSYNASILLLPDDDEYLSAEDALWMSDKNLEPLDLNKIDARAFIVYKFGCYAHDLLIHRCQYTPVTILLANKVPAQDQLTRNTYRNSFHYDANNRILYVRAARLENVGQFVLVLAHTLAHINVG